DFSGSYALSRTRIILAYGDQDELVPVSVALEHIQKAKEQGLTIEEFPYSGGHTLPAEAQKNLLRLLQSNT
ncbi:MAG: hypothetical protein NZ108_05890, partial [Bacteroidia bacterium]|nr:hypothetical protein [Bacteroidia bacterium]